MPAQGPTGDADRHLDDAVNRLRSVTRAHWAVGLVAALWACASEAGRDPTESPSDASVTFHTSAGPVAVTVEVADDAAERTRGLMFRPQLAAGHGMIFVFAKAEPQTFWMKNTLISLDMIFIGDDSRVVGLVENAEPLSEKPVGVAVPARYVVEVPGGFAREVGIVAGSLVTGRGVPGPLKAS